MGWVPMQASFSASCFALAAASTSADAFSVYAIGACVIAGWWGLLSAAGMTQAAVGVPQRGCT